MSLSTFSIEVQNVSSAAGLEVFFFFLKIFPRMFLGSDCLVLVF